MLPATTQRVPDHTAEHVNRAIRERTLRRIEQVVGAGSAAIERRLEELDQEWDIERCLETLAPSLTLAGLTLGLTISRKFLAIPVIVQAFFLQHALQGWCPPIPVLRRLGVRTEREIDEERTTLKSIGDDLAKRSTARAAKAPLRPGNRRVRTLLLPALK